MNRNTWKYAAIAAMLLDHIAYLFLPEVSPWYWGLRFVGNLAAPTMSFLLAEGYQYTSSKSKYALRLLIFALLSQPIYSWMLYRRVQFGSWNIFFTLLMSLLALWFWDDGPVPANKPLMVGALVLFSSLGDWGVIVPVFTMLFYARRADRKKQAKAFTVAAAVVVLINILYSLANQRPWYTDLWQTGMFLFLPFFWCYNGQSGSKNAFHKWFFYGFYPLHLLILLYLAARMGV